MKQSTKQTVINNTSFSSALKKIQRTLNQTSKLFLALLVVLSTALAVANPKIAHAATPPDTCFSFDAGTGAITDYYDNEDNDPGQPPCTRDVDIPGQIGGVDVVALGDSAFANNQLTSVTIPNSVSLIGTYAFQNNQLTSLTIPNSVSSTGYGAFQNNQLTSLTIPSSVTTIEYYAFANNQLTSLTIPSSVSSIEPRAFANNQLTSVTIPNSITTIRKGVFSGNQLTSVTIPNSITSISDEAFANNQLTSVIIPNSVTMISPVAFLGNGSSISEDEFSQQLNDIETQHKATWADSNSPTPDEEDALISAQNLATYNYYRSASLVALYTEDPSNPNSLVDSLLAESVFGQDMNNDGNQDSIIAGQLINPATITINYQDSSGNQIAPSQTFTGNNLKSYKISDNPTNNFDIYYRLGSTQTLTPIAISGYTTPSSATLTLNERMNTYTFVYAGSGTTSTGTNSSANTKASSLASTGSNRMVIAAFASGLALFGVVVLFVRRQTAKRS